MCWKQILYVLVQPKIWDAFRIRQQISWSINFCFYYGQWKLLTPHTHFLVYLVNSFLWDFRFFTQKFLKQADRWTDTVILIGFRADMYVNAPKAACSDISYILMETLMWQYDIWYGTYWINAWEKLMFQIKILNNCFNYKVSVFHRFFQVQGSTQTAQCLLHKCLSLTRIVLWIKGIFFYITAIIIKGLT